MSEPSSVARGAAMAAAVAAANSSERGEGSGSSASASAASRSWNGNGIGSQSGARTGARALETLDDVMRAPSANQPAPVLLKESHESNRREDLDLKEDLWLSTADGRFSSPIIPLRVGSSPSYVETFYVHKHILTKSKYFERALCGDFRESESQSIDLPEENPAIFHFLIAYLYEGTYDPIKPIASVLVEDEPKGKGKDMGAETGADSDSDESGGSYASDISAVSRRRRELRRRREDRHWERMRQKHPGLHRPNCGCPQCLSTTGPPCWHCQAPRAAPPPVPMPYHGVVMMDRDPHTHHHHRPDRDPRGGGPRPPRRNRHGVVPAPPPPPPPGMPAPPPATGTGTNTTTSPPDPNGGGRISGEDLRTWLLAYELNIDVYILANKFLLDDFKREIARVAIDMLETAGSDAAVPEVLFLCLKLYEGLPEGDNLLKMIFARVGFLQPWRKAPEETQDFLVAHPEIAPLLLREMASRREEDYGGRSSLPSMERGWFPLAGGPGGLGPGDPLSPYRGVGGVGGGGPHYHHHYRGGPRW
ncbi:hypothetical protein B0H66DRAFT_33575 [Apodospora peruviana]|uniref:BTB domain-containing protein n=1 Tax=Apodospora peruviana TaxID=516989 RepID=A0AAE0MG01_9PEZI|nr:hypothetical protein B0H66DRAFT_33575 [Apodospora peruviana]